MLILMVLCSYLDWCLFQGIILSIFLCFGKNKWFFPLHAILF